jgi:DNA polymerase-3 subunit delta
MRILFLLARQFNLLLQVKELGAAGTPQNEMAGKVGLQSFIVRNYINYAKHYSVEQLRQAVEDFTSSEEAVKTGRLGDILGVELLLIQYSTEARL